LYDQREPLIGVPKVTRENLIKVFPRYFKKKPHRHRTPGQAPKQQKVKSDE
jgi:hypothetical protein